MITGDSELTAASVSRQLKLTPADDHLLLESTAFNSQPSNISLGIVNESDKLIWLNEDFEKISESVEKKDLLALTKNYTLAMNGKALKYIEAHLSIAQIKTLIDCTTVFARVSPSQKVEYIK